MQKVLVTASLVNATVEVNHVHLASSEPQYQELCATSPTGSLPVLETKAGRVSEANAIATYLANSHDANFLGRDAWEKVQVSQWTNFANFDLQRNYQSVVLPLFGYGDTEHLTDLTETKNHMKLLNTHLGTTRKFFVGEALTYADVDLFYVLRRFFQMVFNENFRNQVFPNVTRWFVEMSNNEHVVRVSFFYFTLNRLAEEHNYAKLFKKPQNSPSRPNPQRKPKLRLRNQ
jgi:glutathione S-transferase